MYWIEVILFSALSFFVTTILIILRSREQPIDSESKKQSERVFKKDNKHGADNDVTNYPPDKETHPNTKFETTFTTKETKTPAALYSRDR